MKALALLLILFVGCIGQSEQLKIEDITSVVSNPTTYADKDVNFEATVTQILPYQSGVMFRIKDKTGGELLAVYTGSIVTVNVGYKAIFSGKLVQDQSFASVHGAGPGYLLGITGIRDVIPGNLEGAGSSVASQQVSDTPTIAEIRGNLLVYSLRETLAVKGRSVQAQNAGNYTYVELDDGTGKMWVAVPQTVVEIGKEFRAEGMVMTDFPSRTLGKTFDIIIFSTGLQDTSSSTSTVISVQKAEGGYTIDEVYRKTVHLVGSTVKVRAIAVKVLEEIMGKTWVYLRDGTGDTAQNTNEIVASYNGTPKINAGDEIIVTGTLVTNKKFMEDRTLDVLIEDATIEKVK